MGQSLTRVLLHSVWSTKNREPTIRPDVEPDLYAYVGGIARAHDAHLLAAGGTSDHIHLLLVIGTRITIADLLMNVKKDSSKWLRQGKRCVGWGGWQDGHGTFSIGASQLPAVKRYLARQKEHHRRMTFKEELLVLFKRYDVEYDERYLWT